ncbi:hypothetical protein HDC95_002430 [Microbacterium sp. AK031]|nr:hypothetical protein [Microbacterium sp. AK031]
MSKTSPNTPPQLREGDVGGIGFQDGVSLHVRSWQEGARCTPIDLDRAQTQADPSTAEVARPDSRSAHRRNLDDQVLAEFVEVDADEPTNAIPAHGSF